MTTEPTNLPHAYARIDLNALRRNVRAVARRLPAQSPAGILAVVKTDAYGHGMGPIADVLQECGVGWMGVSDVLEGLRLRSMGFWGRILVFENFTPDCIRMAQRWSLTLTVSSPEFITLLRRCDTKTAPVTVQMKIDVGMRRFGIQPQVAVDCWRVLHRLKGVVVEGVFTHFPCADTSPDATRRQLELFRDVVSHLKPRPRITHAANSAAVAQGIGLELDLVRPGLLLYGIEPIEHRPVGVRPMMEVLARIACVKTVPAGVGLSYGHTHITQRSTKLATVTIGYSDGYMRALSNKAWVSVGRTRCPVLGRVTMDQILVDVGSVKRPSRHQWVCVMGYRPGAPSASLLAQWAGTIPYEFLCHFGRHLTRRYTGVRTDVSYAPKQPSTVLAAEKNDVFDGM